MGSWDYMPWDNDTAADWFGDLMEDSPFVAKVVETLNQNVEECRDEIRAAASILVMLGRVYIWPIEDYDKHLQLAISKLQELLDKTELGKDDTFRWQIENEIKVLDARMNKKELNDDKDFDDWWRDWAVQN